MRQLRHMAGALALLAGLGSAGAALAAPSYEETVAYLQRIIKGGEFSEQGRCSFVYQFWGVRSSFQAGSLVGMPDAVSPNGARFSCAKGAKCVMVEKKSESSISLNANDEQGEKLAEAMSRLITLCGGKATFRD